MAKSSGRYRFRQGDTVGAADAANDEAFLSECFIDNGDMETLFNPKNTKCLIVGRTGSGKTALILELLKRSNDVLRIRPESLSMNFIANSDAVHALSELGVHLDPFFKLLWRHVLALTIFQHLRPISEKEQNEGYLSYLSRLLRNKKAPPEKAQRHKRVIEFLNAYGSSKFWADAGERVEAMVYRFEAEVFGDSEAKVGGSVGVKDVASVNAGIGGKEGERRKATREFTVTDKKRFQTIVSRMHAKELEEIVDFVEDVLEDAGTDVYIVIDRLDLPWADESVRLRLVRALVETAIVLSNVKRLKVVIAMRVDLIDRVFRNAKLEPGVQAEKIDDYKLIVRWDDQSLVRLLDERVNKLVADKYVKSYKVSLSDVLIENIKRGRKRGERTIDYLLARTWSRPRDAIEFLNACIEQAAGSTKISNDAVFKAESDYSKRRLHSLAEEWQLEYPSIDDDLRLLIKRRASRFRLDEIDDESLLKWKVKVLAREKRDSDLLRRLAELFDSGEIGVGQLRREIAHVFHYIGALGLQPDETERPYWSNGVRATIGVDDFDEDCYAYVHKGLWKALTIQHEE